MVSAKRSPAVRLRLPKSEIADVSAVPKEALAMIRYHSFYPWHREGAYRHLMNEDDEASLRAVKSFNRELRSPLGHPFHYK